MHGKLEKKVIGKQEYYYLEHSFRIGGKSAKKRGLSGQGNPPGY